MKLFRRILDFFNIHPDRNQRWTLSTLFIACLLYGTLVSEFIGKCLMTFRPKLWNEKEREVYDNNNDVVCGIYSIVGYLCALLFMPSLKVAMFVWGICCGIDNIGWLVVYHKNREKFREIEKENN